MPATKLAVPLEMTLSREEYLQLSEGFVPSSQDDRWFVWVDHDAAVHIHRSWTGFEIFEVQLRSTQDGYEVVNAWVNADPSQHEPDPEWDALGLRSMLDELAHR